MKNTLLNILAILLIGYTASAQSTETVKMISGGIEREYILHLPSNNPVQGLPVLLAFHGSGMKAEDYMFYIDFNSLADTYGFIVVYPESKFIGGSKEWNVYVDDKPGHAGKDDPNALDDIQFTKDLLDKISEDHGINKSRVYVNGFSNGGFFSYALFLLANDRFTAFAPVAGNLWANESYLQLLVQSGIVQPKPFIHFHGTADEAVPYIDLDNMPKDFDEYPMFIPGGACNAKTYSEVIPIMENVDKLVFCNEPVEVSLVRILGLNHDWSFEPYNLSLEITKFFGLDIVATVNESENDAFSLISEVCDEQLKIELRRSANVMIYNSFGSKLYNQTKEAGLVSIATGDFTSGFYYISINSGKGHKIKRFLVMH